MYAKQNPRGKLDDDGADRQVAGSTQHTTIIRRGAALIILCHGDKIFLQYFSF